MKKVEPITIPEKLFASLANVSGEIPIAFLTDHGTNALAKKKQKTLTSRSVRNTSKGSAQLEPVIFDNKPTTGFKITRITAVKTYYKDESRWAVEDPRGFCIAIPDHNLNEILSTTIVERGEILDTCVWGRLKGAQDPEILVIGSDRHAIAEYYTNKTKTAIGASKLKAGNKIIVPSGESGTYLGRYIAYTRGYRSGRPIEIKKESHFVLLDILVNGKMQHVLRSSPNMKAIEILDDCVISDQEAELIVNKYIPYGVIQFIKGVKSVSLSLNNLGNAGNYGYLNPKQVIQDGNNLLMVVGHSRPVYKTPCVVLDRIKFAMGEIDCEVVDKMEKLSYDAQQYSSSCGENYVKTAIIDATNHDVFSVEMEFTSVTGNSFKPKLEQK